MRQFAADLVIEQCTTIGSGVLLLGGAMPSYGAFRDAIVPGAVYYAIEDGFNRETGIGTFDGGNSIGRTEILTTVFEGVYNIDNPRAIPLSGNAIVACTANVDVFQQLQTALLNKEDAFDKNSAFNKDFGLAAETVCEGDDVRLSDDRDPNPHDHDDIYFQKDEYNDESAGIASSNLPMITNVNGKLSTTFLEFNALVSQGAWTPIAGTEYPTITTEPLGSFWGISDVDAIDGYEFLTGDLAGQTAKNSDVILWATNGWALIKTNIVPEIYYRRDGEHALTEPLNAGNNLLSNILDGQQDTDAVSLGQMVAALLLKEDAFDKNSAFNKNFGAIAESVCQGNDPRLDDSRPPNAHEHDERYFQQGQFIAESQGAIDAGAPIKANSQGKLSTSLIDISALVFQGGWTPTAGDEYPDTGAVDAGAFWMLDGVPEPAGYTFAGGDLAGETGYSGDIILYGFRGWVLREVNLEPTAYYRLDGTYPLIAPFQAGNQQLKNVANGSDNQDGVTVSQMATQIATREPTISPKNTAFNKNYGSTPGTVCPGNDARLSNSRHPTAHVHPINDVTGLQAALNLKANLASPDFSGIPLAPTAGVGTNTRQIATTAFVISNVAPPPFPAGTRMVFAQASPPTGWSQDTSDTANNRMIRVVNVAGGGVAGSDSPIVNDKVPSHTHGLSGSATTSNGAHQHTLSVEGGVLQAFAFGTGGSTGVARLGGGTNAIADSNGAHTHSIEGTVDPNTGAGTWAPRYINLVIGVKS